MIQKSTETVTNLSMELFLILSSLLFWAHLSLLSLPSYRKSSQICSFNPSLASRIESFNVFWFLCLSVCNLNDCPVSPFRWMGLSMVFSLTLFLGHNRLKDFLAGEVDWRPIETSSGYGEGQHASNYRGSIIGKVPWHKGTEGKLRIGWAAQLVWVGRWEQHLTWRKLRKKCKQ